MAALSPPLSPKHEQIEGTKKKKKNQIQSSLPQENKIQK